MWQGITYVDPSHDPILYEGSSPSNVVVTNAGPGSVLVRGWDETQPGSKTKPHVEIQLRPGNHRIVSGRLVRAAVMSTAAPIPCFAAIGWNVLS